jgi:hypothetical protein
MPGSPDAPVFTQTGFLGQTVPFHAITYDKAGVCTSPATRDAVLRLIRDGGYTDTILFSHGWNNDWDDAMRLYRAFMEGVCAMADQRGDILPGGISPLFLGVSWPSAALLWPWEETPDLAAGTPEPVEESADAELLREDMDPEEAEALTAFLTGKETLSGPELARLSDLLAPQFAHADEDETETAAPFTARDLEHTFRSAGILAEGPEDESGGFDSGGTIDDTPTHDPQAAGGPLPGVFGLRKALRMATVLKMKDRGGVVGANGVATLLQRVLGETGTRLHLVGHSYGAKVTMTALSRVQAPRAVESVLLLQPAVNHLAFSPDVEGRPGGFRKVLERCRKPVLTTRSKNDIPLRHVFHLAVRRRSDLGEMQFASGVSQFAAMGGYGPHELAPGELLEVTLPDRGITYPDLSGHEVIDLNGDGRITGHSDVTNPYTFWAMLQNLR